MRLRALTSRPGPSAASVTTSVGPRTLGQAAGSPEGARRGPEGPRQGPHARCVRGTASVVSRVKTDKDWARDVRVTARSVDLCPGEIVSGRNVTWHSRARAQGGFSSRARRLLSARPAVAALLHQAARVRAFAARCVARSAYSRLRVRAAVVISMLSMAPPISSTSSLHSRDVSLLSLLVAALT